MELFFCLTVSYIMAGNSTQNTSESEDLSYTASKATFLVIFIVAGTIGNACIIISIICTKRLRSSSLNLFTINLALVNLLECIITISVTLASTVTTYWQIPDVLCKIHAFFFNTLWVEMLLGITFMTIDRMMAVQLPNKYNFVHNPPRIFLMIGYTWLQSALFSVPLAVEAVPIGFYSHINVCIMTTKSSLSYIGALSIVCFFIPIIVTIILFIITVRTVYSERKSHQEIRARHHYCNEIDEPKFFVELEGAKFVGCLFVCWIIFVAPFLTAVFVNLYKVSDISSDQVFVSETYSSLTYVIFLKAKYLNVVVLPFFVLFLRKECWQSFKDVVLCRKHNTVDVANKAIGNGDSLSNGTVEKFKLEEEKKREKEEKAKEAFTHNSGFQVPVLFANSNGVHIQTYEVDDSSESDEPVVRGKKCDVIGSQGNLQQIGDDTSDYDSGNEIDPFSVSHPVSSKQIKDMDANGLQKRSNSQPEVRGNKKLSNTATGSKTSVTITSAADSGLDISSKGGTCIHDSNHSLSKPADAPNIVSESKLGHNTSNTSRSKLELCRNSSPGPVICDNSEKISEDFAQDATSGSVENESRECNNIVYEDKKSHKGDLGSRSDSDIIHENGAKKSKSRKKSKDLSLTMPILTRKKKKSKKNLKSGKTNETLVSAIDPEDLDANSIPPRPPPRLAPLSKGSKHSVYQRMSEEIPSKAYNNAQSEDKCTMSPSKTGKTILPHQPSEVQDSSESVKSVSNLKHKSSLKGSKRRGTFDSQTSLLGSCSSADLRMLKDVGFVSEELDGSSQLVSPSSLEVTTPSACHLVDVHKDFDKAVRRERTHEEGN